MPIQPNDKFDRIAQRGKPKKTVQRTAAPSSPGLMMRNVPKPGLNLPDMGFVGPVGRSKPKEAAPAKTETPSIKPAATGMGDVRRAEASKTRPVGAESARNLVYKNGMWYENGRAVRGPSIRALKANLKNRGVDAVRDSLENVYGSIEGDAFIKRATGMSADDPILSEAVKAYRTQSSNPTMPAPYRPDFSAAADKAANYGARLHRQRLLESASRFPNIANDLYGLEALGPATRGFGKDLTATSIDSAYEKAVRPRVKMIGSDDVEFDPFTNDYTPSAQALQKKAFDEIEARRNAVLNAGEKERRQWEEMKTHLPYLDKAREINEKNMDRYIAARRPFVGPPAPVGPPDPFFIPRGTNPNIQMFRGAGLRPYLDRLQSRRFGALEDFLSHG